MHERERGWNSPIPKSPAHPGRHDPSHRHSWGSPGSGRGSPAHGLSRKSSVASLTSTDDGRSSRASSVASRADHDERMHFLEQERSKEREREWNKPHPKLSRSSSSLSLNKSERLRTNSQPTRPDSAASYLSPNRLTLHRHASSNSLNSSRPSSPASSISGHSVELEVEHEIEHERERNWNSPHPKWNHPLHPRRSLSPLPRSPAGSPPPTQHRFTTTPRSRTNSTTKAPSPSVPPSGKSVAKEWIARPKSPLLRSTADNKPSPHTRPLSPSGPPSRSKTDSSEAGFKSRFGWSFPQKTPLPPLELDQDSPQKALSRRPSRASLTASPSHIPVPSPKKSVRDTSASAANQAEKKKSHRRSVTELAESIGAIPPRIHISDGGDAADELPPIPIVNGHDDLSSASEDESVVHTSTPTARPIPLPPLDATHTPNLLTSAANDHALHNEEAQPRSSTPLVSPPPTPPTPGPATIFSLQTPPRRPQFHTPKAVFETPPPPRGMPDLPGPPSSEDEADHTPVMQSNDIPANVTSLKTPRPPGAWLATPAPSRQPSKDPVERAGSAPPAELQLSSSDTGLATPSSTLSRANSLPLQTPAPPGGWINTPGVPDTSARRKGLLKVRFDVESETASEGTIERPSADSSVESKNPDTELPNASWSAIALQNGDASISTAPADQSSADAAPVPAPSPLRDRIRQRSPSIRVLDAYGREQVETESAPPAVHEAAPQGVDPPTDGRAVTPPTPHREARVATVATPRSQSVVRMVDAMGREIEEPVPEEDSFANPPLSRSEALYRMRETLSSMAQEMSDADRPSDKAVFDARSYASLEERCKAAQVARSKISKSLQMAQSAEVELKSRYAPLREKMKPSALLPDPRRFGWRLVVAFILLQAIILVVLYRYSLVQARKIFLTTYYDPFYPELYRYLVKPDTTLHTIPQCPSWSIFTVFSSLQRAGLRGVGEDAWTSVKCAVSSYIQTFWVDLNYAQNTVTHS
ncbi:hypothetical protein C8Q78DRAFT_499145 [Trametes maxima]|nr:hypothetical protein C8Q78DRAFT_499145 [Trametes maxima]